MPKKSTAVRLAVGVGVPDVSSTLSKRVGDWCVSPLVTFAP
jgi:hypothetical protein